MENNGKPYNLTKKMERALQSKPKPYKKGKHINNCCRNFFDREGLQGEMN